MLPFHQYPLELFYEIALHLPLIKDVVAFSLTNSRIRGALSTPVLFKARLARRGWDVSAWEDEDDDAAQSPGDLMRWMCIDHTYHRTTRLFEEAVVDDQLHIIPNNATPKQISYHAFYALELRPRRFCHGDPHARPDGPTTLLVPHAARRTTLSPPSARHSPWSGLRLTQLLTVLHKYAFCSVYLLMSQCAYTQPGLSHLQDRWIVKPARWKRRILDDFGDG